ncbi:hypothetical protein [Streptomyces sp. NPDC002763]|uniref:hypothetical protein n=1 Tax=Streptomyces sp. NPDC002763 TaxID=3154427 RepID=UPI003327DE99
MPQRCVPNPPLTPPAPQEADHTTTALAELERRTGVTVLAHLARAADMPVIIRAAVQGD